MHLGIDFTGGSIIEVRAKQGVADPTNIQSRLHKASFQAMCKSSGWTIG